MKRISLFTLLLFIAAGITAQSGNIHHWETIIYPGDTWKYYAATSQGPPTIWREKNFNDAAWPQGPGGIGYADGDDATVIPACYSLFLRMKFIIVDTSDIEALIFAMDADDSFVAWLNGVEIGRANIGTPGEPAWNDVTPADHEAVMYTGGKPESFYLVKRKVSTVAVNDTNILCIQVNNRNISSSDMSAIAYLSAAMGSEGITYRQVPDWFNPPNHSFHSTLPLLIINTISRSIPDEPKVAVELGVIDNGEGNTNSPYDNFNAYNGLAGFELHGSSSQMFEKKPFGFETWWQAGVDTSVSLLGMPEENNWILHAPYSDKSLIRNAFTYYLFGRFGHYAPRTRFCELFVDYEYRGLYLLVERIKRDKNRVDIARLNSTDVSGADLTGGYILKIDKTTGSGSTEGFSSEYMPVTGTVPHYFMFDYPDGKEILPVQRNYITNKVRSFENVLAGAHFKDPAMGYRPYMDVRSFVDYFIINELSKNVDGLRLSTYLYKDRDDRDPRFHAGPVWDYDLAFGNANYSNADKIHGWQYLVEGGACPFWWKRLLNDPYYTSTLKCRWLELRTGVLQNDSIIMIIDGMVEEIGEAAVRNFTRFPILGSYVWPNPYIGNSYREEIEYLKDWTLQRLVWLDQNIPGSCLLKGDDEITAHSFSVSIYPNPSHGKICIDIQNPENERLQVDVYAITGQLVYAVSVDEPNPVVSIAAASGIYQVSVRNDFESISLKAVVR